MTTADTPASPVTTETVMLAILEHVHECPESQFTTCDVAAEMGVKEYSVRAAFHWLRRFGKIEVVEGDIVERVNRTAGKRYPVTLYRVKPQSDTTAEFQAFYMRFCGGRR